MRPNIYRASYKAMRTHAAGIALIGAIHARIIL